MRRIQAVQNVARSRAKSYKTDGRTIIVRVKNFFENMKVKMDGTPASVIFAQSRKLTAVACGVSEGTVSRFGSRFQTDDLPRKSRIEVTRKRRREQALKRYGAVWGERIREAIHGKLRNEEDVTVAELHADLRSAYEDFDVSRTTLHLLIKALGFSYMKNPGMRFIFERQDLVRKREKFLRLVAEAREREDCLIYMDETWIYGGMVKERGWNDKKIPRFAPRVVLEHYSYGRTAGKNKGRRAIVITALGENGVVPGCTKIFLSGGRAGDGDYHQDMDHTVFEEWLRDSIPHMLTWACGARVSLIMDNAPYHSRQLERVPTSGSSKACIMDYLQSKGVHVEYSWTKAEVVEELNKFVRSVGVDNLRRYASEQICEEFGINLIRLPPFHCFFNPVEDCWSQLKAHLRKYGKKTDRIEAVKRRAVTWIERIPLSRTRAWFRHIRRQEDEARDQLMADEDRSSSSSSESMSISDDSSTEPSELESLSGDSELAGDPGPDISI